MKTLGISSSLITGSDPTFIDKTHELKALYQQALLKYDKVYVIDPRKILYFFEREERKPIIIYQNENISSLSTLIVRGTARCETAVSILVNALDACGCDIIDPLDRFSGVSASKLLTTLKRHQENVGTSSYYAFSKEEATLLVKQLDKKNMFPLISKPIHGRKGINIKKLETEQDALNHINEFYRSKLYSDKPLFLQEFIEFVKEYRAFIIGGKCIGLAEKIPQYGSYIRNAAQGGFFKEAKDKEVAYFVEKNVNNEGILGVDVAADSHGIIHIIEANRAPLWREFEQATGINVAERIIDHAYGRLH
jgi:glutathione synthase/RimK-type ligase-like ATP-grasp enzyme